jgi:cytoskeleton protein RodZ
MTTIGETLKRERVSQNLTLQQLSESTKIGTRMLQAIEAGEFQKLPGGVFTRSFIKQYGAALGLDAAYVDTELRNLQIEPDESTRVAPKRIEHTVFPHMRGMPLESNSLFSSAVWVVLALLVCGGVYFIMNRGSGATPTGKAIVEDRGPAAREPAKKNDKAQAAQPKLADTPTPVTQSVGHGPVQVVLNASEDSWVSISVDGRLVFSGVLRSSEKKEVNAEERVKVTAGNAGGLDILLNGKSIDALGPKGQVRTVELTRAGAQVVSRTPKPAPLL